MIRRSKQEAPTSPFDIMCLPGSREAFDGVNVIAWPVIVEKALDLLSDNPDLRPNSDEFYRLTHRLWHEVRYLPCDQYRTVEDILNVPQVASPLMTLREILSVLLAAGSLERTLLAQRDSIDQQLERLARRRGSR